MQAFARGRRKAVGLAPLPAVNKRLNPCPRIAALEPPEFPDATPRLMHSRRGRSAMIRKIAFGLALGGMLTTLAACGYDPGTRAVTGGLLGAGAGAGIAAATGGR